MSSFDIEFPEDFTNITVGVNSKTSKLKVLRKSDGKVFERDVCIWKPDFVYDYWFRHYFSDKLIIITDYDGFTIYTDELEIIFQKKIEEDKKFIDVYGCCCDFSDIDNNYHFRYWSMNEAIEQTNDEIRGYHNINGIDESIIKHFFMKKN